MVQQFFLHMNDKSQFCQSNADRS